MITKENLKEVVLSLTDKEKRRILANNYEYCILTIHIFNAMSYASIQLTNNFKEVSYPKAILFTEELINILKN